jgi:TRAP-type mannitol/chloroaromatic compound transport system substrate-binding protein
MSAAARQTAMPAIILVLLGALVLVSGLWVRERSQDHLASVDSAQQAQGTSQYHWKMVTTWPRNFPGLGTSPQRLAKWVEQMSAGRLIIEVYGAGEMVPAMQVFDAVSQGTAEMGHGAAYYWGGKLAVAPFFTTVPFGLTAQEMNGWLHHGGGMELWRKAYEPFNLVPLAAGNTGVQMAGWFNREIDSMDDLVGLKMRIPGLAGKVFERAGGTAVTIAGGDIYTSLQTGVIDATEWVGPYNDRAFGLHEVGKYYYYPGWHEPGPTLELLVNKSAWDSLPADLQQIVTVAARAINQDMLDQYTALNNQALQDLVQNHGVQLRKLPQEVLGRLQQISAEVVAEMAASNPQVDEVYQSYQTFRDNVENYHHISEQAYLEAREQGPQPPPQLPDLLTQ